APRRCGAGVRTVTDDRRAEPSDGDDARSDRGAAGSRHADDGHVPSHDGRADARHNRRSEHGSDDEDGSSHDGAHARDARRDDEGDGRDHGEARQDDARRRDELATRRYARVMDTSRRVDSTPSLHRVLGLVEVTAGGVSIIIGAGIYVLLGEATAEAGPLVWFAFLAAAVLSALTGLSYAELSSMFPSAAGEYEYTRHAMPEWVAFVVGWTMILGLVVAAATVSIGFARYIGYFIDLDARVAALMLLAIVSGVAMAGIKQSARLMVALSSIQVAGLVFVAAIGLPHIGDADLLATSGFAGVLRAAALVFFAFIGFDEVITLAEE